MGFYTVKPVKATLKKTENWFSRPIIFIKLLFVIKIFVLYFLSGRFIQVLLYNINFLFYSQPTAVMLFFS